MIRKIAIVGSKSLLGYDDVYRMIDDVVETEISEAGSFILVNGGEDGVDLMAAEIALSRGLEYQLISLEKCSAGCSKEFCFEHSYKPRSFEIASQADRVYRIYDESCSTSTCEVTAKFGEDLGKKVTRRPVDLLAIER